jgi:hypothetical protein
MSGSTGESEVIASPKAPDYLPVNSERDWRRKRNSQTEVWLANDGGYHGILCRRVQSPSSKRQKNK